MNLPQLITPRKKLQPALKLSPQFDWTSGDFLFQGGKILLGDGHIDWCLKVAQTERNTRLAYSDKIGVELEQIPRLTHERARSEIVRTITEALMIHPRTQSVKNVSLRTEADKIFATFDVNGKRLEAAL